MKNKDDLAALLIKHDATGRAVDTLIECLSATKSYQQDGKLVRVADHATRQKAAQSILSYSEGSPIARQMVLSAKLAAKSVDRSELRDAIDKRLAALVMREGVTVDELVAARKFLIEQEKAEPSKKLTAAEREAEVVRILGIE